MLSHLLDTTTPGPFLRLDYARQLRPGDGPQGEHRKGTEAAGGTEGVNPRTQCMGGPPTIGALGVP
jgi:hypothetical protein